jgi:NifU-like protein
MDSDRVFNPEHAAQPPDVPIVQEVTGRAGKQGEGPYMTVSLWLEQGKIVKTAFETYGCPSAIACGNWLTGWARGRTPEQVSVITAGDLMRVLGGLPLGKEHTAYLAVNALNDALQQLATLGEHLGS